VLTKNLRVIVSLCKSGSTALIHSLAHASGVTCYLQTVKSGQRMRGAPDYSVYHSDHPGVVLSKETIGHSTAEDCTLRVFPSDAAMRLTAPVFLFRDPVDAWAAWSRAGWGTPEAFEMAYRHLLSLYFRALELGSAATAIRYESFGEDTVAAFRRLCSVLGIAYTPDMINWRLRFPEQSPVIWRSDVQDDFDRGVCDSVRAASGFVYRRTDFRLPESERDCVDRLFRKSYEALPAARDASNARRVITGEASS
jgi:hypothetical protein